MQDQRPAIRGWRHPRASCGSLDVGGFGVRGPAWVSQFRWSQDWKANCRDTILGRPLPVTPKLSLQSHQSWPHSAHFWCDSPRVWLMKENSPVEWFLTLLSPQPVAHWSSGGGWQAGPGADWREGREVVEWPSSRALPGGRAADHLWSCPEP
jgi:hypothetical protein